MKLAAFAILLLIAAHTNIHGGVVSETPREHQTILSTTAGRTFPTTTWTPSAKQTSASLTAIQSYLDHAKDEAHVTAIDNEKSQQERTWIAEQIKGILHYKRGYRVQFWGITSNGKKLIYCNFFPAADKAAEDEFLHWQSREVLVTDGGYAFWNVIYDPATKTIVRFDCNGNA